MGTFHRNDVASVRLEAIVSQGPLFPSALYSSSTNHDPVPPVMLHEICCFEPTLYASPPMGDISEMETGGLGVAVDDEAAGGLGFGEGAWVGCCWGVAEGIEVVCGVGVRGGCCEEVGLGAV